MNFNNHWYHFFDNKCYKTEYRTFYILLQNSISKGLNVQLFTQKFREHCLQKWIWLINRSQGWGLLSQFSLFRYFPNFSEWSKHWLPIWYHVHICQVSLQLSCRDTWQIWTWLEVSNLYFCWINISRNEEIHEWSFCNPQPWWVVLLVGRIYVLLTQHNTCLCTDDGQDDISRFFVDGVSLKMR